MVSKKRIRFDNKSMIDVLGGRVRGALGDVADRGGKTPNSNKWLLNDCPAASRPEPAHKGQSIVECYSNDDVSADASMDRCNISSPTFRMNKNSATIS